MTAAHRLALTVAAVAAVSLGLAAWLVTSRHAPPPEIDGYVLAESHALPDVALVDENAASFSSKDFAGSWSFIYFGYTYCPDVCPLTLVELATLKRTLAATLPAERIEYYLVSVDPERDTPERLREYVGYFDPGFHGLTGSHEALAALATATSSLFAVRPGQGPDNYLVDHSSNVVLLDPTGQLRAVFTPPHDPATLAAGFAKVRDYYSAR